MGAPAPCFDKRPTIVGSARAETLRGTSRSDVIAGLGGNDVIKGLGGNDFLCGGGGDDKLVGGAGKDRAHGGSGVNTCLSAEVERSCADPELEPQPEPEPEPQPTYACPPRLQQAQQKRQNFSEVWLDEGPNKPGEVISGVGTMNVAMVFVDFFDHPASESSQELYERLVPSAAQFWSEASQGKMDFQVTAFHEWHRMPLPSTSYPGGANSTGGSNLDKRGYLRDAVRITDTEIDYSPYDAIAIVASKGSVSQAGVIVANFAPGLGVVADGNELKHVQIIGSIKDQPDSPTLPNAASRFSLWHDTAHWMGLPDTYFFSADQTSKHWENAGGWDLTSEVWPAPSLLAWHQLKVGWLTDADIRCLNSPGQTQVTLSPLAAAGGTKALVIPISRSQVYVAEVREDVGLDANACDHGLLVYRVDGSEWNARNNVIVQRAHSTSDPELAKPYVCGPAYNAPFDLGAGENSVFIDEEKKVRIEVTAKSGLAYTVSASYGGPQVNFTLDNSSFPDGPVLSGLQASPSPFEVEGSTSAGTDILFSLAQDTAQVSITIRDAGGQHVRTLQQELFTATGNHTVHWDGRNDLGAVVGPGAYTFDIDAFSRHLGVSKTGTVTAQ